MHSSPIIKTYDSSSHKQNSSFIVSDKGLGVETEASICYQFLQQNEKIFSGYDVQVEVKYNGREVELLFRTGNIIGAFPLISPITGRYTFGMSIFPRFEWSGLGSMLGKMGWKTIPEIQPLPLIPSSEKNIPAWVISGIVIFRIESLLLMINREFKHVEKDRTYPRGKINWQRYATEKIPKMRPLEVPCRFPDLSKNKEIMSAIHFVLRQQSSELEGQKAAGYVVLTLIDKCQELLTKVRKYPACKPSPQMLQSWFSGPLQNQFFIDGIQALAWTLEQRGLAGLCSLQGLPWKMSMPDFFECWIECILRKIAERTGGTLQCGRLGETVTPISWDYPPTASQKSLRPDFILKNSQEQIVIDAKYKPHWYELNAQRWSAMQKVSQETHRHDLLQVLAYSTLLTSKSIKTVLIYPCSQNTWNELASKGKLTQNASIYSGTRKISLLLGIVPMSGQVEETADALATAFCTE